MEHEEEVETQYKIWAPPQPCRCAYRVADLLDSVNYLFNQKVEGEQLHPDLEHEILISNMISLELDCPCVFPGLKDLLEDGSRNPNNIAKITDNLIKNLEKCKINPENAQAGLDASMREERGAAWAYRERSKYTDIKTTNLYKHIAGEEDIHEKEFRERLEEL